MNSFTTFALLLINIICTTDNQQPYKVNEITKIEESKTNNGFTINDELYTLQFQIETTKNNTHNLVVAIKLHKGSSFISPYAKRNFKGKFNIDLGDYKNLNFDGNIIETPRSVEEFDEHPFTNGLVNWVRVNTIYTQPLNILTEDDFEVLGKIRFTIEPRCTLEEIPIIIKYYNGKMKVEIFQC